MNEDDLKAPKRQSIVGVAVIFFKNLRRAVNFFLAVILVQFGGNFKMLGLGLTEWGIILAVGFLIISYLQYLKFFFYVTGDQFVIEKGVLQQEKTNIPFARIQTVNTTQNLVQQFFGVVGLKIDTAGSVAQEIEIAALERTYAEELQNFLMERKFEVQPQQETEPAGEEEEEERSIQAAKNSRPLVHLRLPDLFRVGFTENHLRSGLILFAVINGYVWQYEEYLLKPFEPYLEETASTFLTSWVIMLPVVLIIFILVSTLYSLIRVGLRFFNLKFYLNASGLLMESGLLKRNEYRVPRTKIQYFSWSTNPLRRWVGYYTLMIKQAGTEAVNARRSVVVPGIKARPLLTVLRNFYPDRYQGRFSTYRAHHLLFIQYFTWAGIVPALLVAAVFSWNQFHWLFYLPLPFYLAVIALLGWRYARSVSIRVNQSVLEIKKGWIFPKRIVLKHFKVQNITFSQSIFQKRRELASLTFFTAAGSVSMPHLPVHTARQLYNYLLYKIEATNQSWM